MASKRNPFFPRLRLRPSWRALQILTLISTILSITIFYNTSWGNTLLSSASSIDTRNRLSTLAKFPTFDFSIPRPKFPTLSDVTNGISLSSHRHPIDHLISRAEKRFTAILNQESKSLAEAAATYRKKRNRHPPPGFDAWYSYATQNGALIVESFWDQIYADLKPFWGIEPGQLRRRAHVVKPVISIRDGKATTNAVNPNVKLDAWADMLAMLASEKHVKLPDVDIAVNVNDETGLLVPWEVVDTAVSFAKPRLTALSDVLGDFSGLKDVDEKIGNFVFDPEWLGPRLTHPASKLGPRPLWSLVRPACAPTSQARAPGEDVMTDIWQPQGHTKVEHAASRMYPLEWPKKTFKGYAESWKIAIDACEYPYLQGLHGAFVAPQTMSISQKLFPLFSGTGKLVMGSDILLPGALEWNITVEGHADLTADEKLVPWERKKSTLYWRGPATGGRNHERNWQRFHRHRFVEMMNATVIRNLETNDLNSRNLGWEPQNAAREDNQTFRLPPSNLYQVSVHRSEKLADWVEDWADVAFTDLHCEYPETDGGCEYTAPFFSLSRTLDAQDEFRNKYTAVLDANGGEDSGEFIAKLRKGQIVLRASVFRRWYDSRLMPWVHFVPMVNTFINVYGIMEYFLGTRSPLKSKKHVDDSGAIDGEPPDNVDRLVGGAHDGGHDDEARKIADSAQQWADKVLRKEDMLIYVYRLLLEYARVVDNSRERLGWVGDLEGS